MVAIEERLVRWLPEQNNKDLQKSKFTKKLTFDFIHRHLFACIDQILFHLAFASHQECNQEQEKDGDDDEHENDDQLFFNNNLPFLLEVFGEDT